MKSHEYISNIIDLISRLPTSQAGQQSKACQLKRKNKFKIKHSDHSGNSDLWYLRPLKSSFFWDCITINDKEYKWLRPVRQIHVLTRSSYIAGDIELSKAVLIYYAVISDICLRHSQIFIVAKPWYNVRKHTNEHYMKHDYVLCAMIKTTRVGDLNTRASL